MSSTPNVLPLTKHQRQASQGLTRMIEKTETLGRRSRTSNCSPARTGSRGYPLDRPVPPLHESATKRPSALGSRISRSYPHIASQAGGGIGAASPYKMLGPASHRPAAT